MARCVPPSQQPAWRQRGYKTEEAEPRRSRYCALTPRPGTGWRGRLVHSQGQSLSHDSESDSESISFPVGLKRPSRLTLAVLWPSFNLGSGFRHRGYSLRAKLGLGLAGEMLSSCRTGEASSCMASPPFPELPDGVEFSHGSKIRAVLCFGQNEELLIVLSVPSSFGDRVWWL